MTFGIVRNALLKKTRLGIIDMRPEKKKSYFQPGNLERSNAQILLVIMHTVYICYHFTVLQS